MAPRVRLELTTSSLTERLTTDCPTLKYGVIDGYCPRASDFTGRHTDWLYNDQHDLAPQTGFQPAISPVTGERFRALSY